jgi:antitoxin ParD1/3/4
MPCTDFAHIRTNGMIFYSLTRAYTMTTVRKTITLTDQQDGWVKAQIQAGRYTNDSEYIRDLIRREQERTAQVDAVRAALIEGENSGAPQAFDAQAFKQQMRATHG